MDASSNKSLPVLELKTIGHGWGPTESGIIEEPKDGILAEFQGLPFQQYNKCDRVGRVVDWLGGDRYMKKGDRYTERMYGSAANAGSQFDYVHDNEDSTFQLVDTGKPQKPQKMTYRRGGAFQFRKLFFQRDQERREQEKYGQSSRMKREVEKERVRQYKIWQKRGGGRAGGPGARGGRRDRQPGKGRQASIEVRPDWKLVEELDFQRLNKLSFPNVEPGQDIKGESYGLLYYLDRSMDKVSVKAPIPLKKCGGSFYSTTTLDDPIIKKLAQSRAGNVFGTDIIIATLMAATRSAYSWDIIINKVGNTIIFDKRGSAAITNPVDALTVSETAPEMNMEPGQKTLDINTPQSLALEALYINQNFRRQALKQNEKPFALENTKIPYETEEGNEQRRERSDCQIGYKYRTWNLGNMSDGTPIKLVVRTEIDAVLRSDNDNVQYLTIKAFNEWDSSAAGGVDWRSKLDTQKAAVLATEVRNNSFKVAKWNIQAILAGSDYIRFGYVSRLSVKNSSQHEILGIHQARPMEFARSVGMNLDNSWGILRAIIDFFMKQPNGRYIMIKDPVQNIVRIYSMPEEESDSEEDESEDEKGSEEEA